MFNSGNSSSNAKSRGNGNNQAGGGAVNIISQNTAIYGEIQTEGDIRIDGSVEGTIYSRAKVVIGESGNVKGNVFCTNADVSGKMNGNIYADALLHLKKKAVVKGDIHIRQLIIESGATLNGNCSMGEKMVEKHKSHNTAFAKSENKEPQSQKTETKTEKQQK